MFEDKFESVIKEEVNKAVASIITREDFEVIVRKAITDVFELAARKQEMASLEYISEKQAGELFPIAASTLKTWRCRKIPGPPYSRVGDRIIYKVSNLRDFIHQHKV